VVGGRVRRQTGEMAAENAEAKILRGGEIDLSHLDRLSPVAHPAVSGHHVLARRHV